MPATFNKGFDKKQYGDFSIAQPEKQNWGVNNAPNTDSENPGTAYFQYTIEGRDMRHPYRNPRQNYLPGNALYPNL